MATHELGDGKERSVLACSRYPDRKKLHRHADFLSTRHPDRPRRSRVLPNGWSLRRLERGGEVAAESNSAPIRPGRV